MATILNLTECPLERDISGQGTRWDETVLDEEYGWCPLGRRLAYMPAGQPSYCNRRRPLASTRTFVAEFATGPLEEGRQVHREREMGSGERRENSIAVVLRATYTRDEPPFL